MKRHSKKQSNSENESHFFPSPVFIIHQNLTLVSGETWLVFIASRFHSLCAKWAQNDDFQSVSLISVTKIGRQKDECSFLLE